MLPNPSGRSYSPKPLQMRTPTHNWMKVDKNILAPVLEEHFDNNAVEDAAIVYTHASTQSLRSFMVFQAEGQALHMKFYHQHQGAGCWDIFEYRVVAENNHIHINALGEQLSRFFDTPHQVQPNNSPLTVGAVPQSMVLMGKLRQDQAFIRMLPFQVDMQPNSSARASTFC